MGKPRIVDLSLTVQEDRPASWPTHMAFQRRVWNWYATEDRHDPESRTDRLGPYFTEWLLMDEHTGTHCDAPSHFLAGAPGADAIPLSQMMGRLAKIEVADLVSDVPGHSPLIGVERLQAWENRHGPLTAEHVVVFQAGWDRWYQAGSGGLHYAHAVVVTQTEPGWPAPGVESIRFLLDRGVRCVGTDAPSIAPAHEGRAVHIEGLGGGMVFIEGLAHLDAVPETGAQFLFLPVKIRDASGCPGRAVAFCP